MEIKHSLVVPCFNEEGNIENFLAETRKAMNGYTENYEIVFVNDGSRDTTSQVLKKVFQNNKDVKIKVIEFSRNFGKEAAMYAGLTHAAGDYVTVIDADLQQDPKYAVEMGRILDSNPDCDMVAAFQEQRKEGKFITFCKTMFYKVINRMTEVPFIADASDFRTMRRPVVETILQLTEYHRFSKGIFSWVGYNTVSIPYEVKDRTSGESKWNFGKLLKYALDGIVAYTDVPLKLPLYFGGITGAISVIVFIVSLILDLTTYKVMGFAYLTALMLLLVAILSLFLGIMGYYLGKIHSQVKNRPIFITREILTYEEN